MKRPNKAFLLIGASLVLLSACSEPKKSKDIIAKKPVVVKTNTILKIGDYKQSRVVEWVGSSYTVTTSVVADESLPTAKDGNQKYYDNKITITINRKDGSEFFSRTFTKSFFDKYLDDNFRKNGALLGIVYYKTEGDDIIFAASVGNPDKMSDEYIPMVLKISKMGNVTISKDNNLDTASPANEEIEDEDDV